MDKFKVGDKVVRVFTGKAEEGGFRKGDVYTISRVSGDHVKLRDYVRWYLGKDFKLTSDSRKEKLKEALDTVSKYNIDVISYYGGTARFKFYYDTGDTGLMLSSQELVDKIFPSETKEQKELRELEEQQRTIADKIKTLRESL